VFFLIVSFWGSHHAFVQSGSYAFIVPFMQKRPRVRCLRYFSKQSQRGSRERQQGSRERQQEVVGGSRKSWEGSRKSWEGSRKSWEGSGKS
jgi:hypothetical protein